MRLLNVVFSLGGLVCVPVVAADEYINTSTNIFRTPARGRDPLLWAAHGRHDELVLVTIRTGIPNLSVARPTLPLGFVAMHRLRFLASVACLVGLVYRVRYISF